MSGRDGERAPRPSLADPFHALTETAADAVVTASADGVISSVNAAACALFRRSAETIVGQPLTVLLPERFRQAHSAGLARYLATRESHDLEKTIELVGLRGDGIEFAIELSLAIWAADTTRFTVFIRDITVRAQEREAMRQHLGLLDNISDAVITFDASLHVRSWSRGAAELYGWTAAEALGQHASILRSAYITGSREELLHSLAAKRRWTGELRQHRKDGRPVRCWVNASAIHDDAGSVIGMLSINRDITELREAEESTARLAAVVESCDDAVYSTTMDGVVETWNGGAERLYGYGAREIIGRPVSVLVPTERVDELTQQIHLIRNGQGTSSLDTIRLRRDGGRVEVMLTLSPIRDRQAHTIGISTIARDVTDRRKLERQVMLSGRMASVGTLAAGVAHEINNPLTYVISNLDALGQGLHEIESDFPCERVRELDELATEAREGAERIRKIVRGMKTFSRAEEERRSPVDVRSALELSITLTYNQIKHRARVVKDYGPCPIVDADESRLAQVFTNLLVNAAQAIPEGRTERNEIQVVTRSDAAGRAIIEIRDTGSGIEDVHRARLFDPFFTTKPVGSGTGLGLAICHGIVTSHGGEITYETEVGKGTTFRVALPGASSSSERVPVPRTKTPSERPPRKGTVLIVDDEPAIARALARILGSAHDVTMFTNSRKALAAIASGQRFDAILCDLMMPDVTGMELHAQLTKLAPEQVDRMVFVTGGAFTPSGKHFLDSVPNARVEKPFDAGTVRALVRALVR
ncbi:MAG: PAS domain S-box protein [Deltaproteobacteria bacterium]|nr:PAS domain S-box protein [Deltaproteobacteria bacterium]